MNRHVVTADEAGRRLDAVLPLAAGQTRSYWGRQIAAGRVRLNGQPAKASQTVAAGDQLDWSQPPPPAAAQVPELKVVYENADFLVVDKPAGILTHRAEGNRPEPTVADFARAKTTDSGDRPGIVHRLDRDTSGLLIIAKTPAAKAYFQKQFQARQIQKTYLLLVTGKPKLAAAVIDLPLSRRQALKRGVASTGETAQTEYRLRQSFAGYSLIEAHPRTGRTHQLRAHFAHIGHPIVGDRLYGQADSKLRRQFLHAAELAFTGPDGQSLHLSSPLPPELQNFLLTLKPI